MDFTTFTEQQLQAARKYAASVNRKLASEALTADYFADHVDYDARLKIQSKHNTYADEIERGEHDLNFTIMQRMYYYLTGECVAFLP